MADRYAYVPCIGLFIIIAWGLGRHSSCDRHLPRVVPAVAALCLILAFAAATTRYLQYWQNGVKLFTQASIVAGRPDFMIEDHSSGCHVFMPADMMRPFSTTEKRACCSRMTICHYNMAEILFNQHQLRDALEQYQLAGSLTDRKDMALWCLINFGRNTVGPR